MKNLKKFLKSILTVIIIYNASVLTSCTNSDNPASPAEPDLGVAGKIIGKWMTASVTAGFIIK